MRHGPRGQSCRCHGYIAGQTIFCAREEFSAGCKFNSGDSAYMHRLKGSCECGVEHNPADPPRNGRGPRRKIVAVYQYRDETNTIVHETVRYEPKRFLQRRPDGNGEFIWKDVFKDVRPVIYNLPEILAAPADQVVWICEGEKDAGNLMAAGLLATCNPIGALEVAGFLSEFLRGRVVRIIPDNDPPENQYPRGKGAEHALRVARSLAGVAASVRIVTLSHDGKDVSDWLAAGHTVAELDELAEKTAEGTATNSQTNTPVVIEPDEIHRSELGNARRLVELHGADIRYWAQRGMAHLGWCALEAG